MTPDSVYFFFAFCHMLALDLPQAVTILSGIADEEIRFKPAVLATQLGLQEQQQDLAGALSTAQEGLQWWQNSMTAGKAEQSAAQTWLLQQIVHLQLKAGRLNARTHSHKHFLF